MDFIEIYKRVLSGQSSSASPPSRFEESSFTECRYSPWYQLHFLIHSASAVIGVEAAPSTAGFPTNNCSQGLTSLPVETPSLRELEDVSLDSVLMDLNSHDLAPPGPYCKEDTVGIYYPQSMSMDEPAPLSFLDQSVAAPSLLSLVGMDGTAAKIGIQGILQTTAGVSNQDHYHPQPPIDPNSQG